MNTVGLTLDEALAILVKHGVASVVFNEGSETLFAVKFHPPTPPTVTAQPGDDESDPEPETALEQAAARLAGRRVSKQGTT